MSKEEKSEIKKDFFELKTSDVKYSRGCFFKYMNVTVIHLEGNDEGKDPMNGEYMIKDCIMRFKNGLIHGGVDTYGAPQPAIVLPDNHTEWWENGQLHRDDGPAIITKFGNWEEYWYHGSLVMIRASEEITINQRAVE